MNKLLPLFGMNLFELEEVCLKGEQKKFVAKQLAHWLYQKNVSSFEEMKNVSAPFKAYLQENYCIHRSKYLRYSESVDGTRKYLFHFEAGYTETAMIPGEKRTTVCVSSQSGCRFGCSFCATGAGGFSGHLTAGEILEQIYGIDENQEISNIVYMGMGEPLDNLQEVLKSIEILTENWGRAISPSRITVSTIGLPAKLDEFLAKSNVSLALSLHSPFPEERVELIPAQKSNSLEDIIRVLKKHKFNQHRRLTFEYIVFKGKNHSYKHARAIGELLKSLNARINLIPYNEVPALTFQSPESYIMNQFKKELELQGFICTVRNSRGQDIEAACGMLAAKENNPPSE
ncbi:MAG: 23S rRNA (adenine(2503)-C(2))-methyltransferase RlmN [Bacteroidales bacterium]|nr:23S rRNA (adenine(2503)-C(2))-methyltransferase RlmN [Bacteroidales bacterium]